MADRKILINRHTTGSTAPVATEMYQGEIAVAHKTGEETLWTKNNDNVMVPFISCAQTISIVSGMISSVDVVYDVEKKAGEPYINVETAATQGQKTFTLSTSGVASETNLNALSSATVSNLQNMTNILSALTDVVITGITGDDIITATKVDETTGSNTYNLTHKTATAVTGFNKLDTDAYGHVTGATAVATADIEALGFQTSAETGEEIEAVSGIVDTFSAATVAEFNSAFTAINNLSADTEAAIDQVYGSATTYADDAIDAAIEELDSSAAVTAANKYLTGIAIADGKISGFTEADLPELDVEVIGSGNVVASISVDDHKITYQTASVATSEGISELSGAVKSLSAATVAEFDSAFTAINALSAGTIQLSADTVAYVNQLSGYAHNEIAALSAGTIQLSADTKAAIDELAGKAVTSVTFNGVEKVANNVATLVETQLATAVTGDGNVFSEIAVSNHTITMTKGITALQEVTATGDSYVNASVAGKSAITVSLANVADSSADITAATTTGALADAKAVKDYVESIVSSAVNYKGATSGVPTDPTPIKGDLWIADSAFTVGTKNVEVGDFIIYNGSSWDVIEKNLDGAITGNLTQNTVTLGDSTNSVKSLANGSAGQVLTMVDGAPAWANDPELSVVSAGTGNVVSNITVNDHEITFTKGVTAADDADLQAVSGIVDTFSAATVAEFNSAFTAINTLSADAHNAMIARDDAVFASAVTYVGEQIDEVYASAASYADSAITAAIDKLDSVGSASTTGHYLTSVTITDGKITAVGEEEVPAATPVTTVDGTTGNEPAAVLSAIVTGGTEGHQLTLNKTNKVFSASTADSALTSVSASMAYAVSSAATITSGQVTDIVTGIENTKVHAAESADTAAALTGTITSGQVEDLEEVIQNIEVNSAATAESADTAAVADKVANALTMTDGTASQTYDGSEAKSLTFGTATSVSGEKSMTMTSAGVVDVNVIDCGTY